MYYRTEGIIISHKNFSEADRLLTIYTKDHGKITCIAKGARRPKSRKAGHVQLGNWCKIFVAHGKNIDILTEVETKRAFGFEDLSPTQSSKIYHLLELVDYLTEFHQTNTEVFFLLTHFLKMIVAGEDFKLISSVFKVKLLSSLGFFSSRNLKNTNLKRFFQTLESQEFTQVKNKINLETSSYLKLLAFLDSIVENLAQKKLKTTRFVYG